MDDDAAAPGEPPRRMWDYDDGSYDDSAVPAPGAEPADWDDASAEAPVEEARTTEWFSVEDYLAMEDPEPALPRRRHHVTTVVVSHDGAVWLPAVLTTLAKQTRGTDAAVGVDTGSVDASPDLLAASFGQQRTVRLDHRTGFGDAVRIGLEHLGPPTPSPYLDVEPTIEWIWLLHDDSAPDTHCLEALLDTADDNPSAAVLGPKILGWHDRRLLLEAGVTVTGSGRRVTNLDRREHDQGQHDGVRDVLAVSSAGMLVRRDVWEALDGFDPALPLFRDDLDFCWRAHRLGERVITATDATIHHREASAHGRRSDDLAPRPHRADREAAVHVLLAQAPTLVSPFVVARLFIGSLVRAAIYLLGKDVAAARDEVGAVLSIALHPSKVRASRARVARTAKEPAGVVRPLRAGAGSQLRHALEVVGGVLTTSGATAPSASVSALDSGPVGDDADFLDDGSSGLVRRVLLAPGVLLVFALIVIAVLGTRGLWIGDGVLQGGALQPSPAGAGDLWQTYRQAWHDVGPGSTTPAPPYLVAIAAVAFFLLGKAPVAVTVLLLLGIPLAGWAAYVTLRGLVPSRAIRLWAAAAYALLPAMTGAVAGGRIGTTMAAVALPFALRSLVRITAPTGTLRRAAGTAMLVAIVLSVAPGLWLVLLVAGVVGGVALLRTQGRSARPVIARLAVGLLVPLVLLLPWSMLLFTDPVILLLEPGVTTAAITDPNLQPWYVLLLHPGGPGMSPLWMTLGIVIAGFLALLRTDRFRIVGAFAGLGGLALLFGLVQSMVLVTPPGSTGLIRPWPGPATLLLGLALIGAAAAATEGLRGRLGGSSFTLGQPLAAAVAVLALLAPVLSAGWFGIGHDLAIRRAPAEAVPAFVAADSESAQAPRTLVIDDDASGRVLYTLLNGPGPQLGDAETGPPAAVWEQLDPYVADMASGRGGEEIEALAGYGIRYIVLAPGSSRELIPTLDGEPGLRRLSSSGGEVLWRVAGTTTRARVVAADKATPVGLAADGTVTADPYIDQAMPDGQAPRSLVLGTTADAGWRAVSVAADGTQADLVAEPGPGLLAWSQSYEAPDGATRVRVWFDSTGRDRWLWLQVIVLLVLVVLALPERRRVDPDPDLDDDAAPGAAPETVGDAAELEPAASAETAVTPADAADEQPTPAGDAAAEPAAQPTEGQV